MPFPCTLNPVLFPLRTEMPLCALFRRLNLSTSSLSDGKGRGLRCRGGDVAGDALLLRPGEMVGAIPPLRVPVGKVKEGKGFAFGEE